MKAAGPDCALKLDKQSESHGPGVCGLLYGFSAQSGPAAFILFKEQDRLYGFHTDCPGLFRPIAPVSLHLKGRLIDIEKQDISGLLFAILEFNDNFRHRFKLGNFIICVSKKLS